MEKPAENDHPIHPLIERRWSPRAFSDQPVEADTLRSLLEAARWAPSCFNDQPWHFILGTTNHSPNVRQEILDCLTEGNRSWAQTAPVLGISVARTRFEYNQKPNRHALHDVGLAMGNLTLEAMDHDLFVHQMAGFVTAKARTKFNIPGDHEPVAAFALGHPGDPSELPDDRQQQEHAERSRKPLSEMVFGKTWNQPAGVVNQ